MSRRRLFSAALLAIFVLAANMSGQAPPPTPAAEPAASPAWRTFYDVDGKPLPFATDEELLQFLRTAEPTSEKNLGGGINFPLKVVLERNGVRANAVFRDVDVERDKPSFGGGKNEIGFKDSYVYEPAAYELGLMLGLDNVPPAVLRKHHYKNGSFQIFVENAMTELKQVKEGIQPPDDQEWKKQVQMMNVFDALIYNTDRNRGNVLITPDWRLWMIDHTRAFRKISTLQDPESIHQCERSLYQKLKTLDEVQVRQRMKPYLSVWEIDALLARRKLLLARLDKLIAENGEDKVLYTFVWVPAATGAAKPQ